MKKLLGIVVLGLLLSSNVYADTMNEWIAKGYKVKNEDIVTSKYSRTTKIFTLMNKRRGFIVICTVPISRSGTIYEATCLRQ